MNGTWDTYFEAGVMATPGSRIAFAIVSVKHELVYNGQPVGGMNLDVPEVGAGTVKAIKAFQKAHGLVVDGSAGPATCLVLWRKRCIAEATRVGAPKMLLAQQKSLESADDPACVSLNGDDRGLAQINRIYHGVAMPDSKAFTASLALPWQADYMRQAYDGVLTTKGKKDWDLALASYNVGWAGARAWDRAGRPNVDPDGRPNVAARYVRVVKSRTG